ncbi:GNAT family N-acetyltransferase [Bacillus lacus]|uniref:GNAT family N-acetyltransferase n=1 Tax=Metabacillus lacus TaxID=1983721 RepID=A0A7X2J2R0_9BACI|nr:GNAT family N-acetyltransferase [Metabacillus lacus]MRX74320.1 GNAT family N-acetyltransferase [Metabacillus lacus]
MNPILLDFPSEFTTERLLIRAPQSGDGKAVHDAILSSMDQLRPWMPFAQTEPFLEETEANIREAAAHFLLRKDLRLLVFHKETKEFLASSGLHRINWEARCFEIGYWISSKYEGMGYMTEAVEGIIHFAKTELDARRIEIRVNSDNVKSRRIPEKLGFQLEGILRRNDLSLTDQSPRDTCIFSLIF